MITEVKGKCQYLNGHRYALFNGKILAINLKSYNNLDSKRVIKFDTLDHDQIDVIW